MQPILSPSCRYPLKIITVVDHTIQKKPVLNNLPYTELKPFHKFGPLIFYSTTRYKWAHRHYTKYWNTFRPNMHLNKNNPA